MFISKKKHQRIIERLERQHANELRIRDFSRSLLETENCVLAAENKRLKAQLEAKASFKAAQETPFPAPVPAIERPKYEIVHLSSMTSFKTLCGESPMDLNIRRNSEVEHAIVITPPHQLKLTARQSWCADCLD